ncbi:Uncharacterised protein [Segatella copri]|nr:Uncharacterised protein [Segatella copri]
MQKPSNAFISKEITQRFVYLLLVYVLIEFNEVKFAIVQSST